MVASYHFNRPRTTRTSTRRSGTTPAGAGSRTARTTRSTRSRDHPRGCGEQIKNTSTAHALEGPSPRVRGAGDRQTHVLRPLGTIPADAGSRPSPGPATFPAGDHPRGCGEQRSPGTVHANVRGPSPRVRGAAGHDVARGGSHGTIPAGVRSRGRCPRSRRPRRDHPRRYGKQFGISQVTAKRVGPFPRMRGSRWPPAPVPARAWDHPRGWCGGAIVRGDTPGRGPSPRVRGAARRAPRRRASTWDHPRECGEQFGRHEFAAENAGPSPRVRGAAVHHAGTGAIRGIIPAGAGAARPARCPASPSGDHPRRCGEQHHTAWTKGKWEGPSPQVLGAGPDHRVDLRRDGTIPADAGSRSATRSVTPVCGDHPRKCGEQGQKPPDKEDSAGPSPRVRGAAPGVRDPQRRRGTIPAGAGSRAGRTSGPRSTGDHPRGCGEQPGREQEIALPEGPSPRVQGAAGRHPWPGHAPGIIPAGAGSSRTLPFPGGDAGDHPRGCGEQPTPIGRVRNRLGPSPRVRGAEHAGG